MKTSNSVLCAVFVFVLGLSAAVSPPHALAAVETVHPATMCFKTGGGADITRAFGGTIENRSPTAHLAVQCDVVNEVDMNVAVIPSRIIGSTVATTDRHPSLPITCDLIQSIRIYNTSAIFYRYTSKDTVGASDGMYYMHHDPPDPNGLTGHRSINLFNCVIPPTSNGAVSQIHYYSVVEE